MLTHHKDRGLLAISGNDAKEFLQSVITQDVSHLEDGILTYAAHLTPQGKFLFDFFVGMLNGKFILDCTKEDLMPLAKSLHGYVINKHIIFEDISEDLAVYTSFSKTEDGIQDPRHPDMGYRLWKHATSLEKSVSTDTRDYHKKRIELLIPENDAIPKKTLINELNFERIHGVSFDKGCYVGQELTARTKFRTKPKKKLFLAQLSKPIAVQKGTSIMSGTSEVGWLFSNIEGQGIALIRLRHIEKTDLTVDSIPLSIHTQT